MQYRRLGNSGLKVSVVAYGNWITGHDLAAEQTQIECIQKSVELGVNLIDTAEIYGAGNSEKNVGAALKAMPDTDRDDLVISTKFIKCGEGPNNRGLGRKHLVQGMKNSLERMGLDYVDVMFCHRYDNDAPLLETIRTINHLIDQDKAFYWGTSEFTAQQLMDVHRICEKYGYIAPIVEQPQYSMVHREKFEVEYGPLYDNFGMGTTIWSPLAGGILTGKYNEGAIPEGSRAETTPGMSKFESLFSEEKKESTVTMLKGLGALAAELEVSQAQLCLAWSIKNKDVSTALYGATRVAQVEDNIKAVQVMDKLTPEILERIEGILNNKPTPLMNWNTWSPHAARR